ncbi:MAG TPA: TlpA disulfide reductase family protein [Acidobacteriaceae bacterium]|nr:TlpA disulfide reductase family protein [Acidobacteriaceae bacterium]
MVLIVLIALIRVLTTFHLRNIFGTPLLGDLLCLSVILLAIVAGRSARSHACWHGLLAGVGMGVPGFVIALYTLSPDLRGWRYMLGRPSGALWIGFASILVITSLGAQSTALWRERRRLFSFATVVVSVGCVVATWVCGFRILRSIDRKARFLQASNAQSGFDMPLPDLKLTALDGTPIGPSELQGHVTVLDFWGTWCGACIAELPSLERTYKEYSGNAKVRFLLVNPEIEGDTQEKITHFLKRKQITMPIALDPGTPYLELSSKLHNEGLPLLLVVDQRGHIRLCRYGFDTDEATTRLLHSNIDRLLTTM